MSIHRLIVYLTFICLSSSPCSANSQTTIRDYFTARNLDAWQVKQGDWNIRDGQLVANSGFSILLAKQNAITDLQASADIAYDATQPCAAAGIVFRFAPDSTGYLACIRKMESGTTPEFGSWERPVLELYRLDNNGWKLLQESKVPNAWTGNLRQMKVVCHDADIWVFYDDMLTPVIRQQVQYFSGELKKSLKKSITPRIDFELPDEKGSTSPDASAGVPDHDYSIRWTGLWVPPANGEFTLSADSDGRFNLWIDDIPSLNQQKSYVKGKPCRIKADYVHSTGPADVHLRVTGPGIVQADRRPVASSRGLTLKNQRSQDRAADRGQRI